MKKQVSGAGFTKVINEGNVGVCETVVGSLTRVPPVVYVIAALVILGAIAVAGRVLFAPIPNVQPVTFLVAVAGFAFGPLAGVALGAATALFSNQFLGQGPWTVWQMFAWGLVGFSAGLLRMIFPVIKTKILIGFTFIWGYLFGWIMNMWFCTFFYFSYNAVNPGIGWIEVFLMACIASFWFDTLHALGNVGFTLVFGAWALKNLDKIN